MQNYCSCPHPTNGATLHLEHAQSTSAPAPFAAGEPAMPTNVAVFNSDTVDDKITLQVSGCCGTGAAGQPGGMPW